jgi:polysaccharide deacetylase family protein (PEP-CTERM system associated)
MLRGKPVINALTIDLEDWYQGLTSTAVQIDRWESFEDRVVESTSLLLDLLRRARVKATFFVLGYVADQFPELIRQVADAGHEIGLHGYYHYRVDKLTRASFREDLLRGKMAVTEASGVLPVGFRAPMFSINGRSLWALEILAREGFLYDSSVFPTQNMLYGYPQAPREPYKPLNGKDLIEIPMSTVKLCGVKLPVSGGFYLRFLPYSLIKRGLKRINSEGLPAIVYLHPWDLDPDQPCINPTLRERFTHYYNLKTTEDKLVRLLRDFKFAPMIEIARVLQLIEGERHD